MTRRETLALAALLPTAALAQPKKEETTMFDELLKASLETKKGLTIYIKGQTVVGVVLKMANGAVELRNQAHSRLVVRTESIDAVAIA